MLKILKEAELCERLKALGYARGARIRMYGEEFDVTSNPFQDDDGFAIEAILRRSGSATKLRIPLPIIKMITKALAESTTTRAASEHLRSRREVQRFGFLFSAGQHVTRAIRGLTRQVTSHSLPTAYQT